MEYIAKETSYDLLDCKSNDRWYRLWNDATGETDVNKIKNRRIRQERYRRLKGIKARKIIEATEREQDAIHTL